MSEKNSNIFRPNTRNLRVSKIGDKDLQETAWIDPHGDTLLHLRVHSDWGGRRVVLFPLLHHQSTPLGSGSSIRVAYRKAYRQYRLLRRDPARMARSRANALRAAWKYRQRARRYADTVNALTRELKVSNELRESQARIIGETRAEAQRYASICTGRDEYENSLLRQLEEAKDALSKTRSELADLRREYSRLQHNEDYYRRRLGLPTSDDLKVVIGRPFYPFRSQSEPEPETLEVTGFRIHAALLPKGVSLEDVVAAIEVLPAPAPAQV